VPLNVKKRQDKKAKIDSGKVGDEEVENGSGEVGGGWTCHYVCRWCSDYQILFFTHYPY
jgi:hypothetical protein